MAKDPSEIIRSRSVGSKGESTGAKIDPNEDKFQSYMNKENAPAEKKSSSQVSPMDLAKQEALPTTKATMPSIMSQVGSTQEYLDQVKKQLNSPNLKFKRSHQHLLKNKLSEANNHIRNAANRLHIQTTPLEIPPGTSPIIKFLSYISDGEDQLNNIKAQLHSYTGNKKKLNPSEMLLIQLNLAQAQQTLEYSSILLSKVVDFIKQTINIQI